MVDIFHFEKDGVVYAKGFFNQEGFTFYVLKGHARKFYTATENILRMDTNFRVEEVDELPGEGRSRYLQPVNNGPFPEGWITTKIYDPDEAS